MRIIEIYEIQENEALENNKIDATLDTKLKNSLVNTTEVRLVKDKNNNYYIIIKQYNDHNYFLKCKSLEEAKKYVETIILNLDYSKLVNYNELVYADTRENNELVKLVNMADFSYKSIEDITGILVSDINLLRIANSRILDEEELIPQLMDKVTNKDDAIDFSMTDYSLITKLILFNQLIDELELTDEDKFLINQYKRNEGKTTRVSDILRKDNYYFTGDLEEYIEIIEKWEDLFKRGTKLKKDIILYRGGEGINRLNKNGVINLYDGLVSFSIDNNTARWFAQKFNSYEKGTIYKMKLPKGTNCLSLFSVEDIEGRYIEEMEILLPSFIYEVVFEYASPLSMMKELDISYVGNVPMMNLFVERIRKNLNFPKATLDDGSIIEFDSPANMEKYASKGYDSNEVENYRQIDIVEAIRFICKEGQIERVYTMLQKIHSDELIYDSYIHGYTHIQRVYFIASLLTQIDGLSDDDKRVVLAAVRYHDIGRINDIEDDTHGIRSVIKLEKNSERLKDFTLEEQEIIKFVVSEHCMSKRHNLESISKLPIDKRDRYERILNYLKDADKLDRVRLGSYERTDIDRLSLDTSKKLMLLSYELESYLDDIMSYLWVVVNYNEKKSEYERIISMIEVEEKDREMVNLASQIIDGEIVLGDKISLRSVFKVTGNILLSNAKEYLESLLDPLKRMIGGIKHGR